MSPLRLATTMPSSLLESILDLRSRISNTEKADSLALVLSAPTALVREIPVVAKTNTKKT